MLRNALPAECAIVRGDALGSDATSRDTSNATGAEPGAGDKV